MTARVRPVAGPARAWRIFGLLACLVFTPLAQAESELAWSSLTPSQQQQLAPLKRDWASIDHVRKEKWLNLAGRLDKMPPDERQRVQQRMAEWARLPDGERSRARQQFQETRQLSLDERQTRWQEYQALSPEQRQALARQAGQPPRNRDDGPDSGNAAGRDGARAKLNTMPLPDSSRDRPVAPSMLQAHPGATTNPVSKSPQPARFQQPGLPKIAATPDFVDPATLQPRRGAQAAAIVDKRRGKNEPNPAE